MSTEIWNPGKVTERHEGAEAAAFARDLLMETTGRTTSWMLGKW